MKKSILITLFLLFVFLPFSPSLATSGACSWHDGVDCDRGRQSDGTVYCNDGWTDSMVEYDFTVECNQVGSQSDFVNLSRILREYCLGLDYPDYTQLRNKKLFECAKNEYQKLPYLNRLELCTSLANTRAYNEIKDECDVLKKKQISCSQNSHADKGNCVCDEGYGNIIGMEGCYKNNCPENSMDSGTNFVNCSDELSFVNPDGHCCICVPISEYRMYNQHCIAVEEYNKIVVQDDKEKEKNIVENKNNNSTDTESKINSDDSNSGNNVILQEDKKDNKNESFFVYLKNKFEKIKNWFGAIFYRKK